MLCSRKPDLYLDILLLEYLLLPIRDKKTVEVEIFDSVNRYSYKPYGLFIPYTLANSFAFLVLLAGLYSVVHDGVMADKKFQDIISAAEHPDIKHVVQHRQRSVTGVMVDGRLVLRAANEPEMIRRRMLVRFRTFLRRMRLRQRR